MELTNFTEESVSELSTKEIADKLNELSSQLELAKEGKDYWFGEFQNLDIDVKSVRNELSKVKRQRDAAIQAIEYIMQSYQ